MSQFREQSFSSTPWKSEAESLRELREKRMGRKKVSDELQEVGISFSSDIPKKPTRKNNESRKKRAVLGKEVATRQLDKITDSHNRRLSREMRPAGVPTGSGPSHTAEVDALLRGGIPREAWDSDSIVPGSMDAPRRSTASFESRRGKQIIAETPDHRRLEDIAAPDFSVSEDDDDDDLFDDERTADGENSLDTGEDEYALLAKRYGITLPEDTNFEAEVDREISEVAQSVPQNENNTHEIIQKNSISLDPLTQQKREISGSFGPASEKPSAYQSGGRNVRLSMDHRRSHRAVTFSDQDIAIQGSQEAGFRQDTINKGKETGRRRHLQGLQDQLGRYGLLASSRVPKETKKIVGGSRRIVEFMRDNTPDKKSQEDISEDDSSEKIEHVSSQDRYELAVRKVPETIERHNRKQKFVHKILDWDLDAIEERDFSYEIPFEELDSVNPTAKEKESKQSGANLKLFRTTLRNYESDKKSKVFHEMFLILHDFYKSQGSVLQSVSEDFTDPSTETIKDFEKCTGEATDKFLSELITKLILLKKMKQDDLDRSKKYWMRRYDFSRSQFFIDQTEELIEELGRIRNFFQ